VAFSPDGKLFASKTDVKDRSIQIYSSAHGTQISKVPSGHGTRSFCFSSNGRSLVVGGGTQQFVQDIPAMALWETSTGTKVIDFPLRSMLNCLAPSPDGKCVATAKIARLKPIGQVWDLETGKEAWHLFEKDNAAAITAFAYRLDGRAMVSIGQAPDVCMWDTQGQKELWRIENLKQDGALAGTFSPNGQMIAVGMPKGEVILLEAATGRQRGHFKSETSMIFAVAISPDGLVLASMGMDGAALLWDVTGVIRQGGAETKPLPEKALDTHWHNLAREDAAKAWEAICALVICPKQSVPFIMTSLVARKALLAPTRLKELLGNLDSDDFVMRQEASRQLHELGPAVGAALRAFEKEASSPEAKRRAKELLAQIPKSGIVEDELLSCRCCEILEYIGTPLAQEALELESRGDPQAPLAKHAKAALDRLRRRTSSP
jgi:hypothetical protein